MTQEQLVDAMCDFLREHVATRMELKKANDDDMFAASEWVHPSVHAVYLPFRTPHELTEESLSTAPGMVVMPGPGSEARDGAVTQTLRIAIHIWDPGAVTPVTDGDAEGADMALEAERTKAWRSLATLCEWVRSEVLATRYIGGAVASTPVQFATYNENDAVQKMWPYVVGWVDIPMDYHVSRRLPSAVNQHIL